MRIVIVEGSAVLRAGLETVLTRMGHQVAAVVPGSAALPALIRLHRPDAVLADLRRHDTQTVVTALLAARSQQPSLAVLVHTPVPRPVAVRRLFAAGTGGLAVMPSEDVIEAAALGAALTRVAAGGSLVDPRMAGLDLAALSARERDVLRLMALGHTNGAIAEELCVSAGTVEKRAAAVFSKLGVPSGGGTNRRVLAVLRFLSASPSAGAPAAPAPLPAPLPVPIPVPVPVPLPVRAA
ncbi:response regulator transcription factor [Streptomyces sp. KLOTTS4A1]|uniref:response regulator transcription factor n=1 Tax=Streptomyces sp. KLOTTS4A1 TaxID=3390996 RepID=UPI0039F63116